MTTYEEKLAQARSRIEEHNTRVTTPVIILNFFEKLTEGGGTTDEALAACTWEDLQDCGLPRLLARVVAEIFRHKETTVSEKPRPRPVTPSRAQMMTVEDLCGHYDPREADNPVGKRLAEISKGKRCVVFVQDGTVNVSATTTLVDELRDGEPERDFYSVDGSPERIYRIGERPDQIALKNPLYPDLMLRRDETCTKTNRSWQGIPDDVRVLVYLAVTKTREIKIASVSDAHAVLDLVGSGEDASQKTMGRYPNAIVEYQRLKATESLPSLKVLRGNGDAAESGREGNDPFNTNRTY